MSSALLVFFHDRGASRRIGRRLAPRLHEVGRVIDHRGEVALGGAAKVPRRLIFEVVAVEARPNILGPQTAGSDLCDDLRIADADRLDIISGRHDSGA